MLGLGATDGRILGPSGTHHTHRNIRSPIGNERTIDFHHIGKDTNSFAVIDYSASSSTLPFMSVTSNFYSDTVSQDHSPLLQNRTYTSGLKTVVTATHKRTESSFERWQNESFNAQVPLLPTIHDVSIKSEHIAGNSGTTSSTSSYCNKFVSNGNQHQHQQQRHHHQHHLTNLECTPNGDLIPTDLSLGCSRTLPVQWTTASLTNGNDTSTVPYCSTTANLLERSSSIGCSLLQIKREPCQVSEITTSNNIGQHHAALTTVVKLEAHSPKIAMDTNLNSAQSAGAIPVGIAVARQRLHEHVQHHPKEVNRFGIGLATDLGGAASSTSSAFSQNMFFTGTNSTMIPFSSDALTMGVPNLQNAVRTPPTLWQYPTQIPVESMLPMQMPPVGFQLVRDPSTGHCLFLPTATTIDKMYISYPEPFQQAVVWPSYPSTTLQAPHLLMPPMTQQMPAPPLAPLQFPDYLSGSTMLHQHTQTHSTRLVALTSDAKRPKPNNTVNTVSSIPLPIPTTTLIKIEDGLNSRHTADASPSITSSQSHHSNHPSPMYDPVKTSAIQTATITTAVQTQDMSPELATHLYYQSQQGNLIQISTSHTPHSIMEPAISSRAPLVLSPVVVQSSATVPTLTATPLTTTTIQTTHDDMMASTAMADTCISSITSPIQDTLEATSDYSLPMVQDATIQTDTPIMSEDDSASIGADDCTLPTESQLISSDTNVIVTNSICCYQSDVEYTTNATVASCTTDNHGEMIVEQISTPMSVCNGVTSSNMCDTEIMTEPVIACNQIVEPLPVEPVAMMPIPEPLIDGIEIPEQTVKGTPDISGLQLLSNSIEAFEKKTHHIKQEPIERSEELTDDSHFGPEMCGAAKQLVILGPDEPMGGLNLLCALAEQRFQEEVGQRNRTRSTSSSSGSDRDRGRKIPWHDDDDDDESDGSPKKQIRIDPTIVTNNNFTDSLVLDRDLTETFNRVKANFPNSGKWPTPEEVYIAMNVEMRNQLAEMTRNIQEKRRKLQEIMLEEEPTTSKGRNNNNTLSHQIDSNESKSNDGLETTTSSCASPIPELNPKGDEFDSKIGLKKLSVDPKTTKGLVGYIFASKKRNNDKQGNFSTTDEASLSEQSSQIATSPPIHKTSIKREIIDDDTSQTLDATLMTLMTTGSEKRQHKKHGGKRKKEHKKHRRSSEIKLRKRQIDAQCMLNGEHLDQLIGSTKLRVLTAMGGLFYAGYLSAIQPPDVYAVTLDGERGNKPHIMSREEILRDAILEVSPSSVPEILPGTRLCAYWSQQYRCLYPGTSAHPGSPESEPDPKYIIVEFDDGDSGRIDIDDIRYLLSDYPTVEYDPNPLSSLSKRKQRMSQSHTEGDDIGHSLNGSEQQTGDQMSIVKDDDAEHRERRRLKKLRKDKHKRLNDSETIDKKLKHKHKCTDEFCKHRKHKKRRRHRKRHHHDEMAEDMPAELTEDLSDSTKELMEDTPSQMETINEEEEETQSSYDQKKCDEPTVFKEDTVTEEEIGSTSSGSCYNPSKRKNKQNNSNATDNSSKIAAFLPARQLWAWFGKGIKRSVGRGKNKKTFFKTIQRGKEMISVGDSAVFLSTGRPDRPYIGRIESLWETNSNNRVVRVKWYYHPEETTGCPPLIYPGGLFESPHADENDVQTISHKCNVLPFNLYVQKNGPDPRQYRSVYDNNDTFYLAGRYDPTALTLKLEIHIPTGDGSTDVAETKSSNRKDANDNHKNE